MISVVYETSALDESTVATIDGIAALAEKEAREHLPRLPETITLRVKDSEDVIPETGELGISVAPAEIGWVVNPSDPRGAAAIARSQLRFTLFHELHHQARGWMQQGGRPKEGLLDAVVSEGLATAFERDAAGSSPLWGAYPANVSEWTVELRGLPDDADFMQWMVLHDDGRRWIGYRVGTYLADRAKAITGKSAAQLATTPTSEILRLTAVDLARPWSRSARDFCESG